MRQGLLGWAKGYCRGQRAIAVCKGLLPWAKGYNRGQRAIAVGKGLPVQYQYCRGPRLLPWAKCYRCGQKAIAVSQGLLPWATLPTAIALGPRQ